MLDDNFHGLQQPRVAQEVAAHGNHVRDLAGRDRARLVADAHGRLAGYKLPRRLVLVDKDENKALSLQYDKLHKGMVKYQDGLLACADFTAGQSAYDIDFLVKMVDGHYRVAKAAVHSVDGKKRTGHMER